MSNEEEKISKFKMKPQSPCKRFKGKKLGKDEYWSPNLVMSKKIETKERRMSICLTWFPIKGFGIPKLYQNMWCFTRK